jgi:sulfur carrier protein
MVLIVNGERQEVAAPTVTALLDELGYEGSFLAVAVNQEVVRRASWADKLLSEGDRIEILTPRQGG